MNEQSNQRRFRFLSWQELAAMPPPQYLIRGLLPQTGVVLLYGESGCGKTFIVIDIGCSVAAGCDFMDLETQSGSVLYLAGEGYSGIPKRLHAWQKKRSQTIPPDNFHLTNDAPALADKKEVASLIAQIRERSLAPTIIVVDTLSTHSCGREENSNTEMALFLEGAKELAKTFGCLVVVVHHTTKDGSNFRGGYSLKANSDTVIRVDAEGMQPGSIVCEKQRDSEAFDPISFRMEKVYYREEGNEDYSSLVLIEAEESSPESLMGKTKPLTEQQQRVLDLLRAQGPLSRKELLQAAGIAEGSWQAVITPLKVRGLIEKEPGKRGRWKVVEAPNNT